MSRLSVPHLTGIEPLSVADIRLILDHARVLKSQMARPGFVCERLKGRIVLNVFYEDSTRTRNSFEIAAKRLGAEVVTWDKGTSSAKKGETFMDTILNLNAMGPDAIVLRHSEYGAPEVVAARVDCPVVNAGDASREHPTQALLDALTMIEEKGSVEGLVVAICGDVSHSRVARSNMILLTRLGAKVRLIAPPSLMPERLPVEGVETFASMEEGLPGADIVMMLRVQKERMEEGEIPSDGAYFERYGLTQARLALAGPKARVMHPGPMNRGVEIADDVADDPARSLILGQVSNGVAVRMAVMDLILP
ncbi:MAG TPA: aspartate carbamoyltransferase catalytic subunit [Alphaproteobacteria bacterium]|nr:aspartate carbamoyltransferase catalytic subunit [Alphaproteobacteria bacterium]